MADSTEYMPDLTRNWFWKRSLACFNIPMNDPGMEIINDWAEKQDRRILKGMFDMMIKKEWRQKPRLGDYMRAYKTAGADLKRTVHYESVPRASCGLCNNSGNVYVVAAILQGGRFKILDMEKPEYHELIYQIPIPCKCDLGARFNNSVYNDQPYSRENLVSLHKCRFRSTHEASGFMDKCRAMAPADDEDPETAQTRARTKTTLTGKRITRQKCRSRRNHGNMDAKETN